MSRSRCQVSKKKANMANSICFSNKKHKHYQYPNLHIKRFWVPEENSWITLRVSTKVIKTMTTYGVLAGLKRYGLTLKDVRR